ncbi:MAG: winged helix-turn-helix transcriptional regulator, partial [Bacteroidota bacterium]|nr:winged helix-turn-helix transcriptional regulator [Bacteroidota bacterium]
DDKWGDEWGDKWGDNENKVLLLISQNNEISIKKIALATGLSTSGVENIISRLKERNIIKRIGSVKNGHWKIIEEK